MSFTDMTFSFEAVRWLLLSAIGVYAWFIGRQSASAAELLELRTRLTTLEAQMAHQLATFACEWQGTLADPEKLKRFKPFINSEAAYMPPRALLRGQAFPQGEEETIEIKELV